MMPPLCAECLTDASLRGYGRNVKSLLSGCGRRDDRGAVSGRRTTGSMVVQMQSDGLALLSDAGPAPPSPRARLRAVVTEILAAHAIAASFDDDDTLAEVGLTSLDMVKLMLAVENEFTIEIPQADITPETFRSVATMERLVGRLMGGGS